MELIRGCVMCLRAQLLWRCGGVGRCNRDLRCRAVEGLQLQRLHTCRALFNLPVKVRFWSSFNGFETTCGKVTNALNCGTSQMPTYPVIHALRCRRVHMACNAANRAASNV